MLNIVLPVIMLIATGWIFKLDSFFAVSLLVVSSVPTAKTLYIISKQYQIYEQQMGSVIFSTTMYSLISFPIFLKIGTYLWH